MDGGEHYISDLDGQYFNSGIGVDNQISSHRWIDPDSCGHFFNS